MEYGSKLDSCCGKLPVEQAPNLISSREDIKKWWTPKIWDPSSFDYPDAPPLPQSGETYEVVHMVKYNVRQIYTFMKDCGVKHLYIYNLADWTHIFDGDYAEEFWSCFLKDLQSLNVPAYGGIKGPDIFNEEILKKLLSYTPKLTKVCFDEYIPVLEDTTFENVPNLEFLTLGRGEFKYTGKVSFENVRTLVLGVKAAKMLQDIGYECFPNVRDIRFYSGVKTKDWDIIKTPLKLDMLYLEAANPHTLREYTSHLQTIPLVIIGDVWNRNNEDIEILNILLNSPNIMINCISMGYYIGDNTNLQVPKMTYVDSYAFNNESMDMMKSFIRNCPNMRMLIPCGDMVITPELKKELHDWGTDISYDRIVGPLYCTRERYPTEEAAAISEARHDRFFNTDPIYADFEEFIYHYTFGE